MKSNNCKKCPYYGSYYDSYLGDGDEWCECGLCEPGEIPSCKFPLIIRHILAYFEKRKQKKWDKEAEKEFRADEERKAYSLLYDMSEDLYLLLRDISDEFEKKSQEESELSKRVDRMIKRLEDL